MQMTEDGVEKQRKRLLYQSRHRGTKESDLFLGAFADTYLSGFSPAQLDRYDALLAENDAVIFDWLHERSTPPRERMDDVLRLLLDFKFRP